MVKHGMKKRGLALALALVTAAGCVVPSLAAPIGDGVSPACDEAYYATLDYYGNLLEGSVVKSYALNGKDSITDYGEYDQVTNLTDSTPIVMSSGQTSFQFSQAPEHFYFEGKTAAPFQTLPWTISLSYTLNGVPVKAEELAGKTGVVEILLDIVPNEHASDYARYNYTLAATAIFNEDDILSLEAEGAQVQLVGNLRTVLFLCLPGEEQHFTIRVGSNDFSFGGMTFLMMPATLAQLEEISKLSQRKDDLEEDYHALSGSLDELLDAMYDLQGGLYSSAKGLDQLNKARGTISGGKGQLYDDAGVLRGDLSSIADLLEPVEQRTLHLSQTITDSKAVLGGLIDTAVSLRDQLDQLETALSGLETGASDVRQVIRGLADMKSSLRSLQRALGDTHIGGSSSGDRNDLDLKGSVEKTKLAGSAYNAKDQTEFFEDMLTLSGDKNAAETAQKMNGAIKNYNDTVDQYTQAKIEELTQGNPSLMDEATAAEVRKQVQAEVDKSLSGNADWQKTKQLQQLHAAKDNLDFQQFCGTLPGVDDKTAKQMDNLWTIIKPEDSRAAAQSEEEAAPASETSEPADAEQAGPMDKYARSAPEPVSDGGSSESGSSSDSGSTGGSESSGGGTSQTPGGAAVDLIVDGLDSALSAANDRINSLEREINSTINRITRPTGRVVGELADLCDDVDDLVDLIDSAEDASVALRQSSEKLQSILSGVDALRNTLDEYEPTLQEAVANLGTLSTTAATALRDLETLLADSESLMKNSGSQLDAGTKQSLQGLAATLRQTAKAMEATGNVKAAKTTITDIIEDTWEEYTGDVNNILLMDAEAEAVSLTDSRNPAPSSIQILIRTQEIKAEEAETETEQKAVKAKTTFWDRVAQMFKDFWNAITGIFH